MMSLALAMSSSAWRFKSALMISWAAAMAEAIAWQLEEPWALRMFPRRPSKGAQA